MSFLSYWWLYSKLSSTATDDIDRLARQLQEEACLQVSSQIKGYLTGETKFNHPLPDLSATPRSKRKLNKRDLWGE